jgi:hypothetical protein
MENALPAHAAVKRNLFAHMLDRQDKACQYFCDCRIFFEQLHRLN